MPNKNGNAYGLTTLFPIKTGTFKSTYDDHSGHEVGYIESLKHYLANMRQAGGGPFARAPITHFSRFVVVDHLGYNGEPSKVEELQSAYLLWTSCFNGDLPTYLKGLRDTMQKELDDIFQHCVAYEDYLGDDGFLRYVKYCQVTTSFLFADYPNATLEEVLDGLKLCRAFIPFFEENQESDATTLRANFDKWTKIVDEAKPSVPGAYHSKIYPQNG